MTAMTRPRRTHAQARAEMREGILRLGRRQLQERGAAALSVREIARGLGVASSALYRHVRNRDELLTLLVVDAFTELADSVDRSLDLSTAHGDAAERSPASRLRDLAHTVRRWAVDNPARWALLYGSPVPGYSAPADDTVPPGTRVMARFLRILAAGTVSEDLPEDTDPPSPELTSLLRNGAAEFNVSASPLLMADIVEAWTGLTGVVSAEVFTQLGPEYAHVGEELLDRWIARVTRQFRL